MRVGYLGPDGTFTHEAVVSHPDSASFELVPYASVYEAILAVHEGAVERALCPFENSLEGSVNATLDTLAFETEDVAIVGEVRDRDRRVRREILEQQAPRPQVRADVLAEREPQGLWR